MLGDFSVNAQVLLATTATCFLSSWAFFTDKQSAARTSLRVLFWVTLLLPLLSTLAVIKLSGDASVKACCACIVGSFALIVNVLLHHSSLGLLTWGLSTALVVVTVKTKADWETLAFIFIGTFASCGSTPGLAVPEPPLFVWHL